MLTARDLLIAAAALTCVCRRLEMSTLSMDSRVCPEWLRWPRALVIWLCWRAGLDAGVTARVLNLPSCAVAESVSWVNTETERHIERAMVLNEVLAEFRRCCAQIHCDAPWLAELEAKMAEEEEGQT